MTREIIDSGEFKDLDIAVNTFWMRDKEGVQITIGREGYIQMSRDDAIIFFRKILDRLHHQVKKDLENPPWWQRIHKGDTIGEKGEQK